mgnify:CR=1 FL=1
MSLAIFIKSAGNNINKDNLRDTLSSIVKNTKESFKLHLVLEETQKTVLNDMSIDEHIGSLKTARNNISWAEDFNLFFDSVKDQNDWLLYSHDDLKILTPEWFRKSKKAVENRDDIGWITYSQPTWYMHYGEPRSQVARPGFHSDRSSYPCIHECHMFDREQDWHSKKLMKSKLDLPNKPVKIHGPYSVFNLIKMNNMKKVGYCEDWNPYTMLIDEDWSLESLKNNLINIWIPNIFYLHPLRWQERKSGDRFKLEARSGFLKKWGFAGGTANIHEQVVEDVCEQYKNTNIPWSKGKLSYDWEYLK